VVEAHLWLADILLSPWLVAGSSERARAARRERQPTLLSFHSSHSSDPDLENFQTKEGGQD
jgi:hypothetical protein